MQYTYVQVLHDAGEKEIFASNSFAVNFWNFNLRADSPTTAL
jgi:hypothetical protein